MTMIMIIIINNLRHSKVVCIRVHLDGKYVTVWTLHEKLAAPISNRNAGVLVFFGGRKTGEPGKKPSEQGENQTQTQLT